jgi:DNA polymerase-3 subunit delta'
VPFREISGHRRTLALLSGSIALGTLPPSLIFSGITGIGKRRTALALAQTLNCPSPLREVSLHAVGASVPDATLPVDACGECPSCRRIARLVHPDVILLQPDEERGNIRVAEVRALNERLGYRPFEARWRVVVIDEAETLEPSAQNALLKALEEPPSSSIFVLVTARPDALLDTVRSRCPHIRFGPLPVGDVALVLQREHGVGAQEAQALAAVSGGSVGAALDSASASLAGARAAAERLLARLAPSPDVRTRLQAAGEMTGRSPKETGAGARDSLATHLRAIHALLRDIGVVSASGTDRAVANIDLKPALARLAPAFDRERLLRAFAAVDQALAALDGNANPKIVADWVALRL